MQLEYTANALDQGFNLHWYQIDKVLGSGGFGITYLAHDQNLNRPVAIKEYMPEEFAIRGKDNTIQPKAGDERGVYQWGLQRFIFEAQTLAQFNHPNIVRVLSVFEENNTAYMVMDYAQGRDLSKLFKSEGPFNEDRLLDVFIPIIDGLSLVHNENFIHRDIKPANIYINVNDKPVLLDFGSARQAIGGKSQTLTNIFTYGYAPYEQYNDGYGEQGPWTDIYALGACLYVGITGEKPMDAISRGGGLLKGGVDPYVPISLTHNKHYSENFLLAIDYALMFEADQRPQDALTWANMLLGELQAPPLPNYMVEAYEAKEEKTLIKPKRKAAKNTGPSYDSQGLVNSQGLINSHGKRSTVPTLEFGSYVEEKERLKKERSSKMMTFVTLILVAAATVVVAKFQFNLKMDDLVAVFSDDKNQNKSEEKIASQSLEKSDTPDTSNATVNQSVNKSQAVEHLLTKADISYIKKNYTRPGNSAAYYFNEVLKIDPNNMAALSGLQEIETQLLEDAKDAIKSNRITKAKKFLDQLERINTKSETAELLKIKIAEMSKIEAGKNEIEHLLKRARQLKQKNYLTRPEESNAYAVYQKILTISPENSQASNGIREIQDYYVQQFDEHLKESELSGAENDLRVLASIGLPGSLYQKMEDKLSSEKRQKEEELMVAESIIEKTEIEKPKTAHSITVQSKTEQPKTEQPKTVKPATISMNEINQMLGAFKTYMENQQFEELNRLSQFSPGRDQFIRQLFSQYRNMKINISNVQFIPLHNKANAEIKLSNLVAVNGNKVESDARSQFQISLHLDQGQQLKIYW